MLADKLEEAVPRFYVLGERLNCEVFKLYIKVNLKMLTFHEHFDLRIYIIHGGLLLLRHLLLGHHVQALFDLLRRERGTGNVKFLGQIPLNGLHELSLLLLD